MTNLEGTLALMRIGIILAAAMTLGVGSTRNLPPDDKYGWAWRGLSYSFVGFVGGGWFAHLITGQVLTS